MKFAIMVKRAMRVSLYLPSFAAFLAAGTAAAETGYSYSEEDRTLTVTIDENVTNTFDFAGYGSYLTDNQVTNFIKNGKGGLVCNSDLGAYLGDITVEAGTYTFTTNRALGKLSGENVCGSVYVKDGATLDSRPATTMSAAIWGWFNKRICFEGDGVDGVGALIHTGEIAINRMVFSSNLVMTADAKIANRGRAVMYMSGGSTPMWLDMGGHKLTFEGELQIVWGCWNIVNPGEIVSDVQALTIQNGNTHLGGGPDNTLTIKNGRSLNFNMTSGSPIAWTLDASELARIHIADGGGSKNKTTVSYWSGPVLLGDNVPEVNLVKGYWFSLHGPVSGNGGLYASSYENYHGQLNLLSPDNTFSGGVGLLRATLALWSDGALPADGGAVSMTNSAVMLMGIDDIYSLPDLKVHRKGSVAGGQGVWRSVTKTGAGELEWCSNTASDTLDVKEGTVRFRPSRKDLAGLIESERTSYADNTEMKKYWDTVFTNKVTLSPEAYYDRYHHLWTDPVPDSTKPRFMIAYSGYIWNNEATNVTWSFAGAAGVHLQVRVDVTNSFYYIGGISANKGTTYMFTMSDVAPGPHRIDIRGYQIDPCTSAQFPTGNLSLTTNGNDKLEWKDGNFAVGFDPLGRDSRKQSDYIKLIDPGDGSLLTWALPGDIESGVTPIPGKDRNAVYGIAQFANVKFAAGTGMESEVDTISLPGIEGLPTVAGATNLLTITESWTIPAAGFFGGTVLTTSGRLALGAGATVSIEDDDRVGRTSGESVFTVATAEGGIEWPTDVSVSGSPEWKLFLSADAKTLYAKHVPRGTIISLR